MELSSLLRLVEVDIFSLLRFATQEAKNLLKIFAISIELSSFRSFPVTSLWGLIWLSVPPFNVSPLTYIFNRIIDSGIYPNILKNASVSLQITTCYIKAN
jgi:hypothetical protein